MADARAATAASLFLDAVPRLMAHLRRHLADSGVGLTIAQFRCLKMVQRHADLSLGDLAEANGVSAPAMSKLVDGLVDAGLLARRADGDDRRRLRLAVTAAGRRLVDAVTQDLRAQLADRLAGLPAAQLDALAVALARLNDSLQPPTPGPEATA